MRLRTLLLSGLGLLLLAGCHSDDASQICLDAGSCAVDGGADAGAPDAGCALVFNGAGWVCPVTFSFPKHGTVFLLPTAATAAAWCLEHGYLGAFQFSGTGGRRCYSCFYQGGSVGYGFSVAWSSPFDSCDSCGCIDSVTCY